MSTQQEIERRMTSGHPFTFRDLHLGLPDEAYRMADRTIQSWRRRGLISFNRVGRNIFWSLTDAGIAARSRSEADNG